jgi:hypothetical protein
MPYRATHHTNDVLLRQFLVEVATRILVAKASPEDRLVSDCPTFVDCPAQNSAKYGAFVKPRLAAVISGLLLADVSSPFYGQNDAAKHAHESFI